MSLCSSSLASSAIFFALFAWAFSAVYPPGGRGTVEETGVTVPREVPAEAVEPGEVEKVMVQSILARTSMRTCMAESLRTTSPAK